MAPYASEAQVEEVYKTLQATFRSAGQEVAWKRASDKDFGRHAFETSFTEVIATQTDIVQHLKHIRRCTTDQIPDSALFMRTMSRPVICPEFLGVVLNIGRWDFHISLLMQPLVAATTARMCGPPEAAGNDTSLPGSPGPAETAALMGRQFDHIFFSGSVIMARQVARAVVKHLTPTVMELGGQCPATVTKTADIEESAKNVAWVKYLNSGQICLSVNYVSAHSSVQTRLVPRMTFYLHEVQQGGWH